MKKNILNLFRNLLKTGFKYQDYNFKCYIVRRTNEDFRRFKNITDETEIKRKYDEAIKELEILKRQQIIQNFFIESSKNE